FAVVRGIEKRLAVGKSSVGRAAGFPVALAGLACGTALKARWKPNVAGIIAADGDAEAACPSTLHRLPQLLRRRVHTAKVFQQLILPRLLIIRSGDAPLPLLLRGLKYEKIRLAGLEPSPVGKGGTGQDEHVLAVSPRE